MKEKIEPNGNLFRRFIAAGPKIVLSILSSLSFFALPVIYAHLCFYNWSGQFYNTLLVLVAAGCLWLSNRYGYSVAILAACFALYDFCYTALLFLGFLPSPRWDASELTFENWWRVMSRHPAELTQVVLAVAVLLTAAYFLLQNSERKERILK